MDSSLIAAPLPSLSPLSGGSLRQPQQASKLYHDAYVEQNRRWLESAGGTRFAVPTGRKWNSSSRPETPTSQAPAARSLQQQLTAAASQGPGAGPSAMVMGRPSTSLLAREASLSRPGSRMGQLLASVTSVAAAGPQLASSSSWAGPLTGSAAEQQQRATTPSAQALLLQRQSTPAPLATAAGSRPATGAGRPGTGADAGVRPGTGASVRPGTGASRPATGASRPWSQGGGGGRADVWSREVQVGQLPAAAAALPVHLAGLSPRLAALAADPRALALANSGGGGACSAPATPTGRGGGSGGARQRSLHPPLSPTALRPTSSSSQPGTARQPTWSLTHGWGDHTTLPSQFGFATATGGGGLQQALPGAATTRGMIYSVFQDLDEHGEGRITLSAFEDAALMVGMSLEQSQRLFARLDKQGRGYFTVSEWGLPELENQLAGFTRLYMQKTRAPDGRYKGVNEVDNLWVALQLAVFKLSLKSGGGAVSPDRVLQACKFIDKEQAGSLAQDDMHDAFNGLGIYINKTVLDEAMKAFAVGHAGSVPYNDFIQDLFKKNLSKSPGLRTTVLNGTQTGRLLS